MAGGLCQLLSAILAFRTLDCDHTQGAFMPVMAAFSMTFVFLVLLTALTIGGFTPAFVGLDGFTLLRQAVLGAAALLTGGAAALYAILHVRTKADFFFWYSLSLAALAISFVGVFLQPSVGSLLGWTSRGAQQLSGIYLLAAAAVTIMEARARGMGIHEALSGFMKHPLEGYRLVFEAAWNAVISTDEQGRILLWNPSAERLFGFASREVIGHLVSSLIAPRRGHDFITAEIEALQSLASDVLLGEGHEVDLMRRDGEVFPALYSFSARKTPSGWYTSILANDTTARKQAEEERDRLLHQVQAQNAELQSQRQELASQNEDMIAQNQELESHRRELQQQNEEMKALQDKLHDVLRAVSHDLGTPLTVVKGYAELLQQLGQDERTAEIVDGIVSGANRMNSMIQDLLDTARQEAGLLQLALKPVNICECLMEVKRQLAASFDAERIQVESGDIMVQADRDRLERILANLLSNALKYSEREVVVARRLAEDEVIVSVSDSGKGIMAADLPHIFERFYRVEGNKTTGLGMGLYIVKTLVEAHGGHVWADSEVGKGSTFYFTLPRRP